MKKIIIVFICVIAVAIPFNSCKKHTYYYYAYCATGHAPWEGPKREYPSNGTGADTRELEAIMDASDHDLNIHGGLQTAEVRNGID